MYDSQICPTNPDDILGDLDNIQTYVRRQLAFRVGKLLEPHLEFFTSKGIRDFFIAGGCFYKGEVKDLDIWPEFGHEGPLHSAIGTAPEYLTYNHNGMVIQLCRGPVCKSVEELVGGFDFAHCKVGGEGSYRRIIPS